MAGHMHRGVPWSVRNEACSQANEMLSVRTADLATFARQAKHTSSEKLNAGRSSRQDCMHRARPVASKLTSCASRWRQLTVPVRMAKKVDKSL